MASRKVAHIVGPARGGMRRHVEYLAAHPPRGYATAGVWTVSGWIPGALRPLSGEGGVRDADLWHAHGLHALAATLFVRGRPPLVVTVHTDIATQGRTARWSILRWMAQRAALRADALVAVSAAASRHFPGAFVIPPATAPLPPPRHSRLEVRASLGTPPDAVVVLAVARLHRDKALDVLVRSLHGLDAEGWIAGEGPERRRLERLAAGKRVRLLGHRDDVPDLLGAADVFALPSVGEAYGIAVLEALQAGLAVVTTRAGALAELVGEGGVIVDAGDADGFARALASLVEDGAARRAAAQRARALSFPDPADLVARLGEVYDIALRR